MKERSKQPQNSRQKIQTTTKNSEPKSDDPPQASTLRTASIKILSVLDPRVQRAAASAVVARRPSAIKKKFNFLMDRSPLKIRSTRELSDQELEDLDKTINQLQGEAKRDETIRQKNSPDPEG